ncbi:hypothetical protein [Aerosakkonema funiforme]|uniref:hypothetical protein n=1 Tax=Aerosakkonema funiforme TaxID=1246630 RepID=UPI0035B87435
MAIVLVGFESAIAQRCVALSLLGMDVSAIALFAMSVLVGIECDRSFSDVSAAGGGSAIAYGTHSRSHFWRCKCWCVWRYNE